MNPTAKPQITAWPFFRKPFKYPFTTKDLENSLIKLHLPKIKKV